MAITLSDSAILATASSLTATVTVSVASGDDRIVVCIGTKTTETILTIEDTAGNSYGENNDILASAPGTAIWSAENTGNEASNVITVTFDGAADSVIGAYVFDGMNSSPVGDAGFGSNVGTTIDTGTSLTTVSDNSVIVSVFANSGQINYTGFGTGQGNILNADLGGGDKLEVSCTLEWKATAGPDTQSATSGKSATHRCASQEYKVAGATFVARVTAIEADVTYTGSDARITAIEADLTYSEITARVTAIEADVTYSEITARVTAI